MKTPYLTCLAIVTGGLVAMALDVAPVRASIDDTVHLAMDETAEPISELTLSSVILPRDSIEPDTVAFTRTAASRTRATRMRSTRPSRTKRVTKKRKPRTLPPAYKPATPQPQPVLNPCLINPALCVPPSSASGEDENADVLHGLVDENSDEI